MCLCFTANSCGQVSAFSNYIQKRLLHHSKLCRFKYRKKNMTACCSSIPIYVLYPMFCFFQTNFFNESNAQKSVFCAVEQYKTMHVSIIFQLLNKTCWPGFSRTTLHNMSPDVTEIFAKSPKSHVTKFVAWNINNSRNVVRTSKVVL